MRNAPTGFVRLYGNVRTRISGLQLSAPYLTPNTDGINIYGGYDTLLEHSVVDNGDDCVSIVPTGEWIDNGDFCYRDPGNVLCSGGHTIDETARMSAFSSQSKRAALLLHRLYAQ